jgi:hypothetical protein
MKKTSCAFMSFILLAVCILTGCTSNEPFDKLLLVNYTKMYGVMELASNQDARSAVSVFSRSRGPSNYYISKDSSEAQTLYSGLVNPKGKYPKLAVTEVMAIHVNEPVGRANYESHGYLMYFEDQAAAKSFFDAFGTTVNKDFKNKTGSKDGYSYNISYTLTANKDGNCDWVEGVYMRGNSVIMIWGFSPIDNKQTYTDYIFNKIGVIDPATVK